MTLTLTQAIGNLRLDLWDTDSTNYRFTDAALTRALTRSLERITEYLPLEKSAAVAVVAGSRSYPFPAGFTDLHEVEHPTGCWPRRLLPFEVYRDTSGILSWRFQVPTEMLPADATQTMTIYGAADQTIDGSGTTLEEDHWDLLHLGGQAYALDAYVQAVADNFSFADGALHDRIDDTASTIAWQAQAAQSMARFVTRLQQLRDLELARTRGTVRWGDGQSFWDRL